jgi:signal transduction histidine kinase
MTNGSLERVLINAPYGRDGAVFAKVLEKAGIASLVCASTHILCEELRAGAGALIVADEGLRPDSITELSSALKSQEQWSDLPVIVLTGTGEATDLSRYRSLLRKPLGNVSLLERPLRTETAISAVEAALRARRRQYEVRDLLKSIEEANAELKTANRELEEFAHIASHDLQEPLRTVNIYTQLLLERLGQDAGDDISTYSTFICDGVGRMETLLHDLLRFARVIHEQRRHYELFPLRDALSDSLAVLKSRIDDTAATITVSELPSVCGDRVQFSQVFTNLISNSLKYRNTESPPCIAVSAHRNSKEWVVEVSDNGIGFEQGHAERVFGLFKRLHRDAYPGTGIGLAICKRIVERYGGRIWATSEPGKGSRFYFTVPDWTPT